MKKYIKSSSTWQDFDNWLQEDVDLWHTVDWKARNYEPFPVEGDTFEGTAVIYGLPGGEKTIPVTFQKYLRSNPIFCPYYAPINTDEIVRKYHVVRPCYDGNEEDEYPIMDRFDTPDLYDMLSR